jgi:hypothetical protein
MTTQRLRIEYTNEQKNHQSVTVKLSQPLTLPEIAAMLIERCGKRPPMLTLSAGLAIASY